MTWQETLNLWKNYDALDPVLKEELANNQDEEALKDAFGANLSFGTAGMRGVLGAGPNRMNVYTVRQATEGLAQLIEEAGQAAKDRGVAISYDSRHY